MRAMADETSLVALRGRREAVIQRLTDAFALDLLDLDAFEERLATAHQATSLTVLDGLVGDLEPATRSTALAKIEVHEALAHAPAKKVVAVFSHAERRGGWSVPSRLRSVAVFGNCELDFREARFGPGTTELRVRAVFGSVEIVVPPQLAVECEGNAVFGHFAHSAEAAADPDRPVLRILGTAVFGSVEVHTWLPGESAVDARHRQRRQHKAERRLARQRRRLALPPATPEEASEADE